MPKDDLGIEFDEEVERALTDPKSNTLMKVLDYRDRRKDAERTKQAEEDAAKEKKEAKPWYHI